MISLIEYLKHTIQVQGREVLCYDELYEWPEDEVKELQAKDYIRHIEDADGINCTECDQQCYMPVEVRKDQTTGKLVGTFFCCDEEICGRVFIDLKRLQQWKINKDVFKLESKQSQTSADLKKAKNRPTQKEMADRNRSVALAALKFETEHGRLPTVDEIMEDTSYNQKQIYQTDAYKEGKIAKNSAKVSEEVVGKSVTSSEYFDEKSIAHTRAKNRSKSEQDQLDALIEEQFEDEESRYA